MAHRENPHPTIPVLPQECDELLDELYKWYMKVEITLHFTRKSKTFVEMSWQVACDQPCSLITVAAFTYSQCVAGNKMYNLSQTLYSLLWRVVDVVLADVEAQTKCNVFPPI
jgi:hypothetical protein